VLWLVAPTAILVFLSHVWRPCFRDRYVFHSAFAFYLLLGGTVRRAAASSRTVLAVALLLAGLFVVQHVTITRPFRPNWQAAISCIQENGSHNDPVLVPKWCDAQALDVNGKAANFANPVSIENDGTILRERVNRAIKEKERMWVVLPLPFSGLLLTEGPQVKKCPIEGRPNLMLYRINP